jgi:hypothetical protein
MSNPLLRERYQRVPLDDDDETYVRLADLSDQDVAWNLTAMRQEAEDLRREADDAIAQVEALEAWWLRQRSAIARQNGVTRPVPSGE